MSTPNGGLITETNKQYYAGSQQKYISAAGAGQTITSSFNIDLVVGVGFNYSDPANQGYNLNNFKIFTSPTANIWTELTPSATDVDAVSNGTSNAGQNNLTITANAAAIGGNLFAVVDKSTGINYGTIVSKTTNAGVDTLVMSNPLPSIVTNNVQLSIRRVNVWTMAGNIVTIIGNLAAGTYVKIQMNENTINQNNGDYEYTKLTDVIDNFLIAYVGVGKLISSVKRTDVIFHAKRGLQEFSYDTLKSVNAQEVTIPDNLAIIIPQDYVNYVRLSWIDNLGVQRTIFPANQLTSNPTEMPAQDNLGVPTQDSVGENVQGTSQIESRWDTNNPRYISGGYLDTEQSLESGSNIYQWDFYNMPFIGQRYGLNPETSQTNGWFTINERTGMFNFTSDLKNKLVLIEYISDGNAYEMNMKIPKMAEEALYSHIIYSILSVSRGVQEYIVKRFQKERSAKLRNAKIRLSNLKLDQIIQVMRQKSKWIKY
tara:strand:+ start:1061 stop:2512 length:1452 start_codon:yes stop_codon:yes gene_type:complete